MALYDVEWIARGTAKVEADDLDEAESLVCEAISDLDHTMLEAVDVEETEVLDTHLSDDDDD